MLLLHELPIGRAEVIGTTSRISSLPFASSYWNCTSWRWLSPPVDTIAAPSWLTVPARAAGAVGRARARRRRFQRWTCGFVAFPGGQACSRPILGQAARVARRAPRWAPAVSRASAPIEVHDRPGSPCDSHVLFEEHAAWSRDHIPPPTSLTWPLVVCLDVAPSVLERGWTRGSVDAMPRRRLAARIVDALEIGSLVLVSAGGVRQDDRARGGGRPRRAATSRGCRARRATATPGGCWCTWSGRSGAPCRARRMCSLSGSTSPPSASTRGIAIHVLEGELERLLVEPLIVVVDDVEHLAGPRKPRRSSPSCSRCR